MDNQSPIVELFGSQPKQSMADQLFDKLREMIRSGKLAEGYVFPNETEMCQQMNIGRSTLREAYKQLALAGYITRTKRGTFVNSREAVLEAMPLREVVEESSAKEFREYRFMLEQQTVTLAAERATEENFAELESVQAQLLEARDALDVEAMMRLDKAFHMGIANATHNQLFVVSMHALSSVWDDQVLRNFQHAVEANRDVLEMMATDHEAILAALRAHDANAARGAMRAHIANVSRRTNVPAARTQAAAPAAAGAGRHMKKSE